MNSGDSGQKLGVAPGDEVLPLDVVSDDTRQLHAASANVTVASTQTYSPQRQRDTVRLIVTCGFLGLLAYVVVFASIASISSPVHWTQTKEMLQIILPALVGIIGTVIGFYFGTAAVGKVQPPDA